MEWTDGRWHCGGRPIHAGSFWLLKCSDGDARVRIESANGGRTLIAHTVELGREFASVIDCDRDVLRPLPDSDIF